MSNRYCVIMAGGVGSRFWPLSREEKPKQFIDIFGTGRTFIQQTFERFNAFIPTENFIVVTNRQHRELVLEQLPQIAESQILCEPVRRNTAPCIAYAAYRIATIDPFATMIVTPSDHIVTNQHQFEEIVHNSLEFAEKNDVLMTIGIHPNRPETGYGYIQVGDEKREKGICRVKTFTEKPNIDTARAFLESGEFFWNSGIFIWSVKSIIKSMSAFIPDVATAFARGTDVYNTPAEQSFIDSIYSECDNISIDYGVMEHARNVYVCCGDFGWSDVGTWGSLYIHAEKDDKGNACITRNIIPVHTTNSIIKIPEGKKAIIEGLEGYIVADSGDALLICRKDQEQDIRNYVEKLK